MFYLVSGNPPKTPPTLKGSPSTMVLYNRNDYKKLAPAHLINRYNTWLVANAIRAVFIHNKTAFPLIKAPLLHRPIVSSRLQPNILHPFPQYSACLATSFDAYRTHNPVIAVMLEAAVVYQPHTPTNPDSAAAPYPHYDTLHPENTTPLPPTPPHSSAKPLALKDFKRPSNPPSPCKISPYRDYLTPQIIIPLNPQPEPETPPIPTEPPIGTKYVIHKPESKAKPKAKSKSKAKPKAGRPPKTKINPPTIPSAKPQNLPLSEPIPIAEPLVFGNYRLTEYGVYLTRYHVKPLHLLPQPLYRQILMHNSQQAAKLLYKLTPSSYGRPAYSRAYSQIRVFMPLKDFKQYYDLTSPLQPLEAPHPPLTPDNPYPLAPPPPQVFD